MTNKGLLWIMAAVAILTATVATGGVTLRLTYADSGSTMRLHVGERLEVIVPANPSTGYTWELGPGSETILAQEGEAQFIAEGKGVGAEGQMVFRFSATAKGKGNLVLLYRRPCTEEAPPLRTFGVRLIVD